MSAALKLAVFRNGDLVSEVSFDGKPLWLGRGDECALRIEDRAISRKHALIHQTRDGVEFEKKSKFGEVKVDGRDVSQLLLRGGECLKLGEFELRVEPSGEQTIEPSGDPAPVNVEAAPGEDMPVDVPLDVPVEMPVEMPVDAPSTPAESDFGSDAPDGATRVLDAAVLAKKFILDFGETGSFYELGTEEGAGPVFIGRANCHVILEDRKSSRRHVSVEFRDGKHVLQDLGSSNGTLLNGEKLTGERILESGDEIQIGDTKFQYRMVQADYDQRQQEFLQLPPEPEPELAAPPAPESWYSPPMDPGAVGAPAGTFDAAPPPVQDFAPEVHEENRSFLARGLERYRMLPVRKQIIYGVAILAGIYFMLEEEETVTRPTLQLTKPVPAATKKEPGTKPGALPSFEALSPEQQAYVESQYNISFEHYKNRDYDSCLLEVGKIFSYVQDYKNAREIEAFAREGKRKLEAREEERKRKEAERQAQLRLQSLIDQAGLLMDQKKYKEAEELFPEIELMQPENQSVSAWKKIIIEEAARAEAERQEQERIAKGRESLWRRYRVANGVLEEKKYFEALDLLDALVGQEFAEPAFEKSVAESIRKAEEAIAAERDPLLAEGRKFEADGKQTEAYRAYQKALRVDPTDTEAPAGMARIRDALNARARAIYSEGVIAEGFGELEQAEKKYREVLEVVPDDSEYFAKATSRIRKLTAYRYPASTEEKQ